MMKKTIITWVADAGGGSSGGSSGESSLDRYVRDFRARHGREPSGKELMGF